MDRRADLGADRVFGALSEALGEDHDCGGQIL